LGWDVLVGASLAVVGPVLRPAAFEVEFTEASGMRRREHLASCWDVRFEDAVPVRPFCWTTGQRHFAGWWWSATTSRHVGHESWLERDQAMLLDFDPEVVAFSSQPFWLSWPEAGRTRRHAPDYFARLADGTGVVIDVRADDRIPAEDAEVFEMTARACAAVGWDYQRAGLVDPVLAANVRWLAGYRHPRCMNRERATRLREVFAIPAPLLAGARAVGDPLAVLPVLYHLLWTGALTADLASVPLSGESPVTASGGAE
jgi:hypothetical protein